MNQLDHLRVRMILEDGDGRWFFPLGPFSRPRAVPDRQAEDWLLREARQGSWPLMVGVTLLFGAAIWAHLVDRNGLSILLMALGLGVFVLMRQRVVRAATVDWRREARWGLGRWAQRRAAGLSWGHLLGMVFVWAWLAFAGGMILLNQDRTWALLQGLLQTAVCGGVLALELATLLAKLISKER